MIGVIMTVLNEGVSIRPLLESLTGQTLPPDEVVIVDGGSSDNTVEIARSYASRLPLRLLVEPGTNISAGRNRAIAASRADIIAATDAGVLLEPDWLAKLTAPLLADPNAQAAAGFFVADARNVFEAAMGATVLPLRSEIDPTTFLPSSRSVAFRKSAWEQSGGYPEWLDFCEDLIFDFRLRDLAPFAPAFDAVAHFRPRGSLTAFYRQYYRYARGDGKADLWRKRHAARYLTYLVAAPLLLILGAVVHPLLWALFLPAGAVYLRQPYRRLPEVLKQAGFTSSGDRLYAAALVPIIRVVGDVAKMVGYPVGVWWRRQNRPPDWRTTRQSPP